MQLAVIMSFIGLTVAALILWLVRKDGLRVKHATSWIIVAVCFACLGLAPSITNKVAHALGIAYPPIFAVALGFVALILKVLLLEVDQSRSAVQIERLAQKIAMLESELEKSKNGQT